MYGAGIITTSTNREGHHLQIGWLVEFETGKSDITDTGACDTAGESRDAEMAWHTDTTLIISSDQEKLCLDAIAHEQDRAVNRVLREVQDWHTRNLKQPLPQHCITEGWDTWSILNAIVLPMRRMSKGPERLAALHLARGRSLHHKSKSDLQCPTLPGKQCPGSKSFTPCIGHPHSRSETLSRWHAQPRSTTPASSRH